MRAYYRRARHFSENEISQQYPQKGNMEENLIEREDKMRIIDILSELPEPYREVFILRIIGEKCRIFAESLKTELSIDKDDKDLYIKEENLLKDSRKAMKKEVKKDYFEKAGTISWMMSGLSVLSKCLLLIIGGVIWVCLHM